jgi:hypothetical protein
VSGERTGEIIAAGSAVGSGVIVISDWKGAAVERKILHERAIDDGPDRCQARAQVSVRTPVGAIILRYEQV